jgi:cobalamin biosynthesis protein CobT
MIAGKGLRVTQIGAQAYVAHDPRTGKVNRVNIPHIPDDADDVFLMAIQGFIDHEVGHILHTDMSPEMGRLKESTALKLAKVSKQSDKVAIAELHQLHNIVEDPYEERMMSNQFKGSAYNLEKLHEMFLARVALPAIEKARTDEESFSAIMVPMTRAWSGQPIFQRFMNDNNLWAHPLVAAFAKAMSAADIERMPRLKSTADTLTIAEEYYKILHPAPPPPPPPPPAGKPSDEPGDDSKSDEKSDEKQDGEGSNPEKPEDDEDKGSGGEKDETKPEGEDDEPTKEKPKEGSKDPDDAEGDEPAEAEDPADDGDHEPAGDEGDGEDDAEGTKPESTGDDEAGDGDGGPDEDAGDAPDGDAEADEGGSDADDGADDAEGDGDSDDEPGDGSDGADDDEPGESDETAAGRKCTPFSEAEIDLSDTDLGDAIAEVLTEIATADALDSDYRVYTREFDKVEIVKDTSMLSASVVKRMEDDTNHMVAPMQKDIERMMASRSQVIKVPGFRSGRLHAGSLHRLTINDDRVFRRKQEHKSKETAVTLLIDNSGSMRHGGRGATDTPIAVAMKAGFALSQTLERVGIKHEVLGFTTLPYGRYGATDPAPDHVEVAAEAARIGKDFTRVEPLYVPIYKTFDERLTPEVKRRFAMPSAGHLRLHQNIDGECVRIAGSRLAMRREVRKVMIVLSDGSPACESSFPHEIEADLHRAVLDAKKMRIDLVGIGIMDDSVRRFYPKFAVLRTLEELPGAVMRELKTILTAA